MKATLKFNLPEEQEDFELAIDGSKYSAAVFDFDQKLRTMEKYENIETIEVSKVRYMLREFLEDYNLRIS